MDENNVDILKMFEKAVEIKKILSEGEAEPPQKKENNFDISKVAQLMEIMKSFNNSTQQPIKEESPNIHTKNVNEDVFFDEVILTKQLKSMKAVVPFLDYEKQKLVAIAIKIIEAKKMIDYYFDDQVKDKITTQTINNNSRVFGAVKPYLDNEKKYMLEMIEKVFEIREIMEKYNTTIDNSATDL